MHLWLFLTDLLKSKRNDNKIINIVNEYQSVKSNIVGWANEFASWVKPNYLFGPLFGYFIKRILFQSDILSMHNAFI